MNLKNKKVWLLSALSFVLGAGLSAGVFYYKGQFNESSFERQAQNEALSETDDYKIQNQMKVAERTPQSKLRTARKLIEEIEYKDIPKTADYRSMRFKNRFISNSGLGGGNFDGLSFKGSSLIHNDMSGSSFKGANFNKAKLIWAPRGAASEGPYKFDWPKPLKGSDFSNAKFQDAMIKVPDIKDVNFSGAHMQGVRFDFLPEIEIVPKSRDVGRVYFKLEGYPDHTFFWQIQDTFYGDTRIVVPKNPYYKDSEYLEWSKWKWGDNNKVNQETDFRGAFLQGADLSKIEGLHLAKLDGAKYNSNTIFPEGFNPKEHGMILND